MSTPLERAAEALESLMSRAVHVCDFSGGSIGILGAPTLDELARAALEAAIDEGEIARIIARLEPGEEWPTNEELGGSMTGTRDDEFRREMLEQAAAIKAHLLGGAE